MADAKTSNCEWMTFTKAAHKAICALEEGRIDLGEVDKELAAFETVAEVLIDFIFDTISEIGGAPVSFAKLKTLLENEPTAQALRRFMLS